MTSVGKLCIAILVLGAAFFTAKWLHEDREPSLSSAPTANLRSRSLTWQAPAIDPAVSAESQVDPAVEPNQNAPEQFEPKIRFANYADAGLERGDAMDPTSAASERVSGGGTLSEVGSNEPDQTTLHAKRKALLPFVAKPRSKLVEVQPAASVVEPTAAEYSEHTVQFGETLPSIADRFLGNREEYMAIYQANLDVLQNPGEVAPGTVLRIPVRR